MVRHNNIIPYGHFHKKWQKHLKTWFNQPMRKKRRSAKRAKKAKYMSPNPVDCLRPIVHCPSVRYNTRLRAGRGFTLQELKAAKINKHYARTIGIAVDQRRKNRCLESLLVNKQRLLEYKSRLIINTNNVSHCEIQREGINKIDQPAAKYVARVPSTEERKFDAYITLRKARLQQKSISKKLAKKVSEDELGVKMPQKKKRSTLDEE